MIRFLCPTCQAKVQAPQEKAEAQGRCPLCTGMFVVPQATSTPLQVAALPEIEKPPAVEIQSGAEVAAEAPVTEASLIEAPRREGLTRATPKPPSFSETGEEDGEFAPAQTQQQSQNVRRFHPMTVALAASFALVVVITLVKLLGRPGSADASALPPKSQNTPWLTFVPATDPKTPSLHSPEVPQDLRPAPGKPAFLPSLIRPEWEPRVVFDPQPRIKNDPSRQVLPVNQFATTPVIAAPVAVDNRVYVAARDGMLSVINTDTMKVVEQKKYNLTIKNLLLRDSKLMADPQNMFRTPLVDFGRVVQTLDPEDAEPAEKLVPRQGVRLQRWVFNVNEQVVAYQGKYYCPRMEEILVLSGHEERGFHSHVPDLARWRIALLPNGPMGYDNSSVYELDENLCPIRRLIDVNTDTNDPRTYFPASAIASDGKTLCFVSVQKQSARMQIWSLDAKEKIRECTVLADQDRVLQGQYVRAAGKRLFAVGDGYLYCGRELIWMNAATGEVRRYVPNAAGSNQQQNLTPPLVMNQKLFVGFEGGGVFVFDLGAFSAQGERRGEP